MFQWLFSVDTTKETHVPGVYFSCPMDVSQPPLQSTHEFVQWTPKRINLMTETEMWNRSKHVAPISKAT